ncbi:MAG: hypothetical protein GAK35_00800 [Herbaspirillum frisingense]|uniref:O-antigen ligase-related domain-containing protein n=1 Tax=Herbaspirillum frisingense TaxID=92645 RepID=A0A7V8FZ55_9BURK|nr:MAG: hypothetical protein GAK35_00800 [Herbaspirillum frisingense]
MQQSFVERDATGGRAVNQESLVSVPMQWAMFVVVAIFVVLGISVDKIAGISYHLMLLLGLIAVFLRGRRSINSLLHSCRTLWPLYLSASGFTICLILSQFLIGNGSPKDFNFALRFQGFFLLFWFFCHFPPRFFRWLGWGFTFGALIGAANTFWMTKGGVLRDHPNFMPLIAYTELSAILGALAVFSIKWDESLPSRIRKHAIALKLLAGLSGLYSIYLYQSRGAWLAIPVFVIAACVLFIPGTHVVRKIGAALLVMIAIGIVYGSTDSVKQRLHAVQTDVVAFENKSDVNTSLGARFQLWKGSLRLYRENMLIGVGINGYSRALSRLADQGVISRDSAHYPHSHNEVLFTAVLFGTCGIAALLALYFGPVVYFIRYARAQPLPAKVAAVMGVTLCLAFVSDGLVDVMFIWRECGLFYTVLLAVLMAALFRFRQPAPDFIARA